MKKSFFVFPVLFITGLVACKKDNPPQPEPRFCFTCTQQVLQTVTIAPAGQSTTTTTSSTIPEQCNKTQKEIDSLQRAGKDTLETTVGANNIRVTTQVSCVRK